MEKLFFTILVGAYLVPGLITIVGHLRPGVRELSEKDCNGMQLPVMVRPIVGLLFGSLLSFLALLMGPFIIAEMRDNLEWPLTKKELKTCVLFLPVVALGLLWLM